MLLDAIRPNKVKDVKVLLRALEEWEGKLRELEQETGEKLGESIKLAMLVGMVPRDLQDEIFKGAENGTALGYTGARDKIKRITGTRKNRPELIY